MFLGSGMWAPIPGRSVPKALAAVLAILRSSDTDEAKIEKLRATALSKLRPEALEQFVAGFTASEQLASRLQELAGPAEQQTPPE